MSLKDYCCAQHIHGGGSRGPPPVIGGSTVRKRTASVVALAAAVALVPAAGASARRTMGARTIRAPRRSSGRSTVDRVERHQQRLQDIADANGGTRDVFGTGYTASVDYVVRTLERAGYDPQVTPFNYPVWEETQLPVLNQVTPTAKTYGPAPRRRTTRPTSTSSRSRARRPSRSTTCRVVPVAGIVIPSPGGDAERLRGGRLPGGRERRRGAGPARHVRARAEVAARAGRGRGRHDHVQRGRHAGPLRTRCTSSNQLPDATIPGGDLRASRSARSSTTPTRPVRTRRSTSRRSGSSATGSSTR